MSFSGYYLEKHALFPRFISELPHPGLFISIVIPCFDEPELNRALESLWNCARPSCAVEVIVVINASVNSGADEIARNLITYENFKIWNKKHKDEKLVFYAIVKNDFPEKDAGVGLARKTGMDEAVRRFTFLNRPEGVIVGYDADCTCSENYLCEIEKHFNELQGTDACSVQFEHPAEGTEYEEFIYKAVTQYELYLRYYIHALRFTGHPFAFQTIGSAFAVRAGLYCRQGGMNKRKAGEDFYFLQKIIPLGNYSELNTAKVFPSPRTSGRVPFGTGAAIQKMKTAGEYKYMTYDIIAFDSIMFLIKNIENMYFWDEKQLIEFQNKCEKPLCLFLIKNSFINKVKEIKQNSATVITFKDRFFRWFNAFKVLKYMNFSHEEFFILKPVNEVAYQLLQRKGMISGEINDKKMLNILRKTMCNK